MSTPYIIQVSATPGTYTVPDTIQITVTFSEAVAVIGLPELLTNLGPVPTSAVYASGTGTAELVFDLDLVTGAYVDPVGALLDYAAVDSLSLAGGSIVDSATGLDAANLTLPCPGAPESLSGTSEVYVDIDPPTVALVTSDIPDGTYHEGSLIPVRVDISKPVFVDLSGGTPRIPLNSGHPGHQAYATYQSGNGTSSLTFVYIIRDGDGTLDLGYAEAANMDLDGGGIADFAGNVLVPLLPDNAGPAGLSGTKAIVIGDGSTHEAGETPDGPMESASARTAVQPVTTALTEISSGVGDGDDIKVKLKVGIDGRWYPILHKGWFYVGAVEHYLFASKGTTAVSPSAADGVETLPVSGASERGPIVLRDAVTAQPFTRVASVLRALEPLTGFLLVAGTTDKWEWVGDLIPVELVRSDANLPMSRVATADAIVDEEDYALFETSTGGIVKYRVVVGAAADPSGKIFATSLATDAIRTTTNPTWILEQHEMLLVDRNNTVRAMFEAPLTSDVTRPVRVVSVKGGVRTVFSVDPQDITGNVITLPPASYSPSDRVGVIYFVDRGFEVVGDDIHYLTYSENDFTIEYEAGDSDWWDPGLLLPSSPSYVQLNPIISGITGGFIYADDITVRTHPVLSLELNVSPRIAAVDDNGNFGAPVRIVGRVTDDSGNPVPGVPVACAVTSGALFGAIVSRTPEGGVTDWRGEVTFLWRPTSSGNVSFMLSVPGASASTTILQTAVSPRFQEIDDPAYYRNIYLVVLDDTYYDGRITALAYVTSADGSYPIKGQNVYFVSKKSRFAKPTVATGGKAVRGPGVAENTYYWVEGDEIYAYIDNVAGRTLHSNIITIGKEINE